MYINDWQKWYNKQNKTKAQPKHKNEGEKIQIHWVFVLDDKNKQFDFNQEYHIINRKLGAICDDWMIKNFQLYSPSNYFLYWTQNTKLHTTMLKHPKFYRICGSKYGSSGSDKFWDKTNNDFVIFSGKMPLYSMTMVRTNDDYINGVIGKWME